MTGYFPNEEGAEGVFRQAWPIFQVTPDYPPTFIYHGTMDKKLYASSAQFAKALEREGVVHHFASIENGGHAILRGFMSNEYKVAGLEKLRVFLEEHLKQGKNHDSGGR